MLLCKSLAAYSQIEIRCFKLCGPETFTGFTDSFHDPPPLSAENFQSKTSVTFGGTFLGAQNLEADGNTVPLRNKLRVPL